MTHLNLKGAEQEKKSCCGGNGGFPSHPATRVVKETEEQLIDV